MKNWLNNPHNSFLLIGICSIIFFTSILYLVSYDQTMNSRENCERINSEKLFEPVDCNEAFTFPFPFNKL